MSPRRGVGQLTAVEQMNRIVSLVAELSRREREGSAPATLSELAEAHGVSVGQIQRDIRTLTLLGDDPDAEWLLSLRVSQQGAEVWLSSGGPYRRPVRFTPDELLAVQVGLATECDETPALAGELACALAVEDGAADQPPVVLVGPAAEASVIGLVQRASAERRRLEILYAGER